MPTRVRILHRWSFNSRPHKEVDPISQSIVEGNDLSIHDLTRRSTTFRMHCAGPGSSFNSRPHKEFDWAVRGPPFLCISFNSRPHKEVDSIFHSLHHAKHLSIHDLTRRSTANIHNIFLYSHRLFIPLYKSFSFSHIFN